MGSLQLDAQAHGLELTNGHLVTFAGGIPWQGSDGRLLGAIGVSGGQVAQDYAICPGRRSPPGGPDPSLAGATACQT